MQEGIIISVLMLIVAFAFIAVALMSSEKEDFERDYNHNCLYAIAKTECLNRGLQFSFLSIQQRGFECSRDPRDQMKPVTFLKFTEEDFESCER